MMVDHYALILPSAYDDVPVIRWYANVFFIFTSINAITTKRHKNGDRNALTLPSNWPFLLDDDDITTTISRD